MEANKTQRRPFRRCRSTSPGYVQKNITRSNHFASWTHLEHLHRGTLLLAHTLAGLPWKQGATVLAFIQSAAASQQTEPAPATAFQECGIVSTSCRQRRGFAESCCGYFCCILKSHTVEWINYEVIVFQLHPCVPEVTTYIPQMKNFQNYTTPMAFNTLMSEQSSESDHLWDVNPWSSGATCECSYEMRICYRSMSISTVTSGW